MSVYSPKQRTKRQQLLAQRAHGMRRALSPAEARLWQAIRARQLGVIFRRQVTLGGRYIADFFCREAGLLVEVDGQQHASSAAADARRDRSLAKLGYRTLRVTARHVHADLDGVLSLIRAALL
ncbi:MAG: DUF559 domain-containing protein [Myxococcales bacterium]|nr:DUF559 domain-containing protein [Myxococcales bacterium]